jgi:hypothetical protein
MYVKSLIPRHTIPHIKTEPIISLKMFFSDFGQKLAKLAAKKLKPVSTG